MKHPNPVRGYIACPVCGDNSTVHCVGEGELIATGTPPKNARNTGLQYYKCPSCGNSSISKKIDEYITAHCRAEPVINQHDNGKAAANDAVFKALEETEIITPQAVKPANEIKAFNAKVTPAPKQGKARFFTVERVVLALLTLAFLLWSMDQLMPKTPQGGEHG